MLVLIARMTQPTFDWLLGKTVEIRRLPLVPTAGEAVAVMVQISRRTH